MYISTVTSALYELFVIARAHTTCTVTMMIHMYKCVLTKYTRDSNHSSKAAVIEGPDNAYSRTNRAGRHIKCMSCVHVQYLLYVVAAYGSNQRMNATNKKSPRGPTRSHMYVSYLKSHYCISVLYCKRCDVSRTKYECSLLRTRLTYVCQRYISLSLPVLGVDRYDSAYKTMNIGEPCSLGTASE